MLSNLTSMASTIRRGRRSPRPAEEPAPAPYRRARDEIRAFVETLPESVTGNH